MDLSKLTTSDKVIAGSGIVLFVSSFFPWFKISSIISYSWSGWDVGLLWGGIPALLGAISAGIVIATKLGSVEMPKMAISTGQAMLIAGAVRGRPGRPQAADRLPLRRPGVGHLPRSTLASLGLAYGGFLAYKQDGGTAKAS